MSYCECKWEEYGLALLWREGMTVMIQNYSKYHIDSLVCLEDGMRLRLTGFYGQADPNNRNLSWDMLRRVKDTINEGWILAGDFNAILNNAEKEGGRRKPRSSMEDFCKLLEELALIVRQSKSDHEAILMDTLGSKPGDNNTNLRTWFRYDVCWNKEKEERDVITSIWSNNESNLLDKLALVRKKLGPWEGDRNTRYFYVRVSGRRKKNTIEKLKDVHGMRHDEKNKICDIAWNYFNDLFKSSVNPEDVYDLPFIPICVTDGMNSRLSREFTDEEILMAFNQMDPQKAPGIDGIFGSFFKDHWQTVGKYVLKLCHDILKRRNNVACLNKTLLIMIPKVNELCVMANFRPISLYRVIYKIISKVLANRLKEVLPYCISHNQSVFAPGRMIHDNVLITHELMHYLCSSKNGPNKRNNRSEVETFLRILEMFEKMSGQSINLEKSMVCFSPSTPLAQRMTTSSLLKMRLVEMLDSYLGLSILVGKKKSGVFKNILDHIANRINRVIEEIQSMMHRVWWGGREQNRGWNILAWGRMCYPKGIGGLGFRDLWLFNVALLGRQVWRLIHCTDTLCYRVLSSKYFLDGDVFHPKSLDKSYFMWQSIAKAARVLYEGFDWNIGNMRNINIWTDNWGFEGLPSSSIRIKRRMAPENKVCELLNESKDGWNENRILELYGESLRDQICKLTILHNGHDDQQMWFHNPNGFFSSKSAYS
ncbi:uncharacterized protein [Gossypium hirsutum]|uniref:Endonuclease/exonuclease/phosphatase domain-containing protein n=1 Tax=Gossypium hirsutum TaxID=3635 RepID=A0A1U8I2Q7_GOSHI|nr:uncharacterized protein LOC107889932 [Gossypium hirsutum]